MGFFTGSLKNGFTGMHGDTALSAAAHNALLGGANIGYVGAMGAGAGIGAVTGGINGAISDNGTVLGGAFSGASAGAMAGGAFRFVGGSYAEGMLKEKPGLVSFNETTRKYVDHWGSAYEANKKIANPLSPGAIMTGAFRSSTP